MIKKVFYRDNGQRTVNLVWLEVEPNREHLAEGLGFSPWRGKLGHDGGPFVEPGQSSTWTTLDDVLKKVRRQLEDEVRKNPYLLLKCLEARRAYYSR